MPSAITALLLAFTNFRFEAYSCLIEEFMRRQDQINYWAPERRMTQDRVGGICNPKVLLQTVPDEPWGECDKNPCEPNAYQRRHRRCKNPQLEFCETVYDCFEERPCQMVGYCPGDLVILNLCLRRSALQIFLIAYRSYHYVIIQTGSS